MLIFFLEIPKRFGIVCSIEGNQSDEQPKHQMRSNTELQKYADEITSDPELSNMIEALIGGDESKRAAVEAACDQVDEDCAKYAE